MRVFIAIDIDDKIKKALADLQEQLQASVDIKKGDVKWVRPDNIHLTLKFLGEVKDEKIVQVCKIVEAVAAGHKSFELDIKSVGCFGGKSAKVLWVATESNELCPLAEDIDEQLAAAGWPKETRQFQSHLTLCRIKNSKAGIKLAKISEDYRDFKLDAMPVGSVSVYQSQLKPDGPVYAVVGNYKLQ